MISSSPIINPDYIDFVSWANRLSISFNVVIPIAESEEKWKEWACFLFPIRELGEIPNPTEYDNWRDWANDFINSSKS